MKNDLKLFEFMKQFCEEMVLESEWIFILKDMIEKRLLQKIFLLQWEMQTRTT